MKTILILILAIFTLNINTVSAKSNLRKGTEGPSTSEISTNLYLLAPVTPAEATFEEADITPGLFTTSLSPVTPKEATFEDSFSPDSLPVPQNLKSIKNGKSVHYDFPVNCDAKYGCSI